MAENTPEVFEAKRKAIAILGPISGDERSYMNRQNKKNLAIHMDKEHKWDLAIHMDREHKWELEIHMDKEHKGNLEIQDQQTRDKFKKGENILIYQYIQ